jgi:PAS domain S-box-containing protein
MLDVTLECIRAAILLYLLIHLVIATRKHTDIVHKGWYYILAGFSLLFFANLLDITDNIDSLKRFVIIGDTPIQAILEKILGYSAGFLCVTIGLLKWLPAITTRNKLQSSERKFRLAFETSGIGMVILGLDGRFLKANKTFCEITGYVENELLDMTVIEITHPDDIAASNELIENIVTGRKTHDKIEKRYIHKDSSTIWAIVSVSIVSDENGEPLHFVSQNSDITSRKNAELKLVQQRKYLKNIFEAAPTGMLMVDENVIINHINKAAAVLVGKELKDMIGDQPGNALNCVHSFQHEKGCGHAEFCPKCPIRSTINKTLQTGKSTIGKELESTIVVDGKTSSIWLKISSNIVEIEGKKNVILAVDNITESKTIQKQLREEKERADSMAQKAEKANKTKSQFLASMSHEIRTPMNAIIGFSDILAEEVTSEDHKEYVEIIRNSGDHLLQLINDILDYSKIEAGKLDIDTTFCSLQEIFSKVESMMRPFADKKSLRFEFTNSANVPEKIRTDPARVEQCLINLVNNAIKFTDEGHVKVNTSVETIDSKDFICIDVEDTGIGISPQSQQDIFDSFTQGEQGTAKKQAGTGLGLAITKQLTELLGGSIRLASKESEGSTFTILIPIGMKRNAAQITCDANTQPTEKLQFSGNCLVAEDNSENQQLMKIMLERMGLNVTTASSPEDAVKKTAQEKFNLIFIDIPLTEAKSDPTLEKVKANAPDTPIIALTANPLMQDESPLCEYYLHKPITQRKLEKTIKKHITEKQTA